MRVFVGIAIPEKLQEEIDEWLTQHKDVIALSGARLMKRENRHITLLSPWEVEDTEEIVQQLHMLSSSFTPFNITFTKLQFFPARNARYFWVEGEAPEKLLHLHNVLAGELGGNREKRPFRLHTTLVRYKNISSPTFSGSVDWHMEVPSFALFSSHLSKEGAEYTTLAIFPLRGVTVGRK